MSTTYDRGTVDDLCAKLRSLSGTLGDGATFDGHIEAAEPHRCTAKSMRFHFERLQRGTSTVATHFSETAEAMQDVIASYGEADQNAADSLSESSNGSGD